MIQSIAFLTHAQDAFISQKASKPQFNYGHMIKAFNPNLYFHLGGFLNHNLLWKVLTGDKNLQKLDSSCGALEKEIVQSFGSVEEMKAKMNAASMGIMGSGWSWLVFDPDVSKTNKLSIVTTANQDTAYDQYGNY